MTIWILALVLLASSAGLGMRQGAIRVAFSLVGILIAALLAAPLARFVKPLLSAVGLKNPLMLWVLAPAIVFILISIAFKVGALTVHQKVDVHYKYRAGDLQLVLWERLNERLGLCLGLVNGAVYFILISMVIYSFSYWTAQMANPDTDPKTVQVLNRLGRDLHSTGFAKVAAALDPMKPTYYEAADLVGLLYNNPLLEARLTRYPAFVALAESPEIQDIANDKDFTEMRQRRDPISTVFEHPKVQAVLKNRDLVHTIWTTLVPDLKDFQAFLETGRSANYDTQKILGRWQFDINGALNAVRRAKPNTSSVEMQARKKWMVAVFAKTEFIAAPNHQAILKNVPKVLAAGAAPSAETQTVQGEWKEAGDNKYQLTMTGLPGAIAATVEGDRLLTTAEGTDLVFSRED